MMLAGSSFGSQAVGTPRGSASQSLNSWPLAPFTCAINLESRNEVFLVDTLRLDDTLGQPMSCEFTLVNPTDRPDVGDRVDIRYYDEKLFSGIIQRIEPQPTTDLSVIYYRCTASDWSTILSRHKLQRNFTNLPLINIVDSLLDNELAGEGLTLGTVDQGATLPLVDVQNSRAFDVFRDMAGATGQAMYVDADKVIQFRSTTNDPAPKTLTYSTVEASSMVEDLETYRNVQTVVVTGTPAKGTGTTTEEAKTISVQRTNPTQISARQAIEGGTGRYEEIEELTHPTSNDPAQLALLGIGYANLRLATSGTPRRTLTVQVRGYGFRAGQFVSVDLAAVNASGTWLIQKSSFQEQAGQHLIYNLELTQSSTQTRAYEAWLAIVKAGKITVQIPSALTSNLQTYSTPGTYSWTVPAGVTLVEVTCIGGSGGGGGGDDGYGLLPRPAYGGSGGSSGYAVTSCAVVPGTSVSLVVGATGTGGKGALTNAGVSTDGTSGTLSSVTINSVIVCQGNAGLYGSRGIGGTGGVPGTKAVNGTNGADGNGLGDAVTVGGGKSGGSGGTIAGTDGAAGFDGAIEIRW